MSNITVAVLNETHNASSNDMDAAPSATDSSSFPSIYPQTAYWVCSVVFSVIGLIGNVLVFPLMKDVKFSSLSYPVYLMFMAVSDSAVLITYSIQLSLKFFESFHIIGKYVAACRIWMFFMSIVNLLSPWLVVGLTMDRFYCVVFPLTHDRLCTRRKANIVCSCLAALFVLLNLLLLEGVKTVEKSDMCFVEDHITIYVAFMRLVITSNLPCLLILVLNVVIGVHIQRSITFRKKFTSTNSGSRENKQDKSLLPLILISILAFVTTLPSSIVDTVVGVLMVTKSDLNALVAVAKFVLPFNFVYMINFGQNFYILMASSSNYRNVIKRKLNYCKSIYLQEEDVSQLRVPVRIPNTDDVRASVTELNTKSFSHTDSTSVATMDAGGGFQNESD